MDFATQAAAARKAASRQGSIGLLLDPMRTLCLGRLKQNQVIRDTVGDMSHTDKSATLGNAETNQVISKLTTWGASLVQDARIQPDQPSEKTACSAPRGAYSIRPPLRPTGA